MKNKKIFIIFMLILQVFLFNNLKVKALDYSKTYEEAFPDKEFRKIVISCIHYNLCNYSNNSTLDGDKDKRAYYILKIINEKNDPIYNQEIDENLIESKKTDILNQTNLEKINYIFNFKNTNPSKIKDLKGIEYLTNLEIIALKNIGTKEVNLNNNTKLKHIILPKVDYDLPDSGSIFNYNSYNGENINATLEKIEVNNLLHVKTLILNLNKEKYNIVDISKSQDLTDVAVDDSNLTEIKFRPTLSLLKNISLCYNSLNSIDIPTNIGYDEFRADNQKIKLKIELDEKDDKGSFDLNLDIPFTFKKANNVGAPMVFIPSLPHLPTDVVETSPGRYLLKNLYVGKHIYTFVGVIEDYDNWRGILEVEVTKISTPPSPVPKKPPINPKTSVIFPIQITIILLISIVLYFSFKIYKYKNYVK